MPKRIKTTSEVLLKCGFVYEGTELGDDGALEYGTGPLEEGICFLWVPAVGRYTEEHALGLWISSDYGKNDIQIPLERVEYLDQIQDLYFLLTGNKIKYKKK